MKTKMKKYGNGGWEKTTPGHVTPKMSSGGLTDGDKPKKGLLKRLFGRKTDKEKEQEFLEKAGPKPKPKPKGSFLNFPNEGPSLGDIPMPSFSVDRPKGKKGMVVKTKYKTGGMVNSNTKVQSDKTPGSKGVKSGTNTKVSASKKAKGKVGGTSKAPKTAVPKAKYGMTMKGKKSS